LIDAQSLKQAAKLLQHEKSESSVEHALVVATEMCPNSSLHELLQRGPFNEPLARFFFRQIVEAVLFCHRVCCLKCCLLFHFACVIHFPLAVFENQNV
jgi:serine/threonine protein kinase